MIITVIGGPDRRKAALAEEMVIRYGNGGTAYYAYTGIPFGKAAQEKSSKQLKKYRNKGYTTLEIGKDPEDIIQWVKARRMADSMLVVAKGEGANEPVDKDAGKKRGQEAVIIDRVAEMAANFLFDADEEGEKPLDTSADLTPEDVNSAADALVEKLGKLAECVGCLILIADEVTSAPEYGKNGDAYISMNDRVNEAICAMSDQVKRNELTLN